jgi:hypothetical protein
MRHFQRGRQSKCRHLSSCYLEKITSIPRQAIHGNRKREENISSVKNPHGCTTLLGWRWSEREHATQDEEREPLLEHRPQHQPAPQGKKDTSENLSLFVSKTIHSFDNAQTIPKKRGRHVCGVSEGAVEIPPVTFQFTDSKPVALHIADVRFVLPACRLRRKEGRSGEQQRERERERERREYHTRGLGTLKPSQGPMRSPFPTPTPPTPSPTPDGYATESEWM